MSRQIIARAAVAVIIPVGCTCAAGRHPVSCGRVGYLEVLDSERQLFNAEPGVVRTRRETSWSRRCGCTRRSAEARMNHNHDIGGDN